VQGSEWDFGVFSGIEGVEKPDLRIYELALQRANLSNPREVLHIGDSHLKDYLPAKSVGMHAVLLDRFQSEESKICKKEGAIVFRDLTEVEKWMCSHWGIAPN
jgi:FMN phosphatase YigB (HAD superfamily)